MRIYLILVTTSFLFYPLRLEAKGPIPVLFQRLENLQKKAPAACNLDPMPEEMRKNIPDPFYIAEPKIIKSFARVFSVDVSGAKVISVSNYKDRETNEEVSLVGLQFESTRIAKQAEVNSKPGSKKAPENHPMPVHRLGVK